MHHDTAPWRMVTVVAQVVVAHLSREGWTCWPRPSSHWCCDLTTQIKRSGTPGHIRTRCCAWTTCSPRRCEQGGRHEQETRTRSTASLLRYGTDGRRRRSCAPYLWRTSSRLRNVVLSILCVVGSRLVRTSLVLYSQIHTFAHCSLANERRRGSQRLPVHQYSLVC